MPVSSISRLVSSSLVSRSPCLRAVISSLTLTSVQSRNSLASAMSSNVDSSSFCCSKKTSSSSLSLGTRESGLLIGSVVALVGDSLWKDCLFLVESTSGLRLTSRANKEIMKNNECERLVYSKSDECQSGASSYPWR